MAVTVTTMEGYGIVVWVSRYSVLLFCPIECHVAVMGKLNAGDQFSTHAWSALMTLSLGHCHEMCHVTSWHHVTGSLRQYFAKLTTIMTRNLPPSPLVSPLFSHRGLQQIYSCRHSHLTDNRHISRDKYLSHILSRHAGPERVCRAQSVRNVHGATSSSRLPGRGLVWVGYQRASLARIISCLQLTASRYWSLGRDSLVMDALFWPGADPRRTGPFIDWSHSHPGVTIKFHLDSRLW